jgi:hypothetical protein
MLLSSLMMHRSSRCGHLFAGGSIASSLHAAASLHHFTAAAKIFSFVLAPLFNVLTLVVLLSPQLGCGLPPLSLFENLGAIFLLIYHLATLGIFCTLTSDSETP